MFKARAVKQGFKEDKTAATETAPLPPWKVKRFLTALGMLGWLASTVRLDVAYAYSRIAQHCATPTESALNTVYKAFAYLRDTKNLCLSAEVYDGDINAYDLANLQGDTENIFRFLVDADHAGNQETQNKRKSQNGELGLINNTPFYWYSKTSSVAFASAAIGEAHADTSSGAVETYAAGNATQNILGRSYVAEEMGFSSKDEAEAHRLSSRVGSDTSGSKRYDSKACSYQGELR